VPRPTSTDDDVAAIEGFGMADLLGPKA